MNSDVMGKIEVFDNDDRSMEFSAFYSKFYSNNTKYDISVKRPIIYNREYKFVISGFEDQAGNIQKKQVFNIPFRLNLDKPNVRVIDINKEYIGIEF